MVKCCLRNCYGIEIEDLRARILALLPEWLMNFLLDISKCANNQTQKNALANFKELVVYMAKELFDILDKMDKAGDFFDLSDPLKIFEKNLSKLLDKFNNQLCNGGFKDIEDLLRDKLKGKDGQFNNSGYPTDLSDKDKNYIRDLLDENNNYNDSKTNPLDKDNNITLDDRFDYKDGTNPFYPPKSGNGNSGDIFNQGGGGGDPNSSNVLGRDKDGLNQDDPFYKGSKDNNSGSNGSFLDFIDEESIMKLNLGNTIYKCFDPVFNLENYLFIGEDGSKLFVSKDRATKLRKLHDEILLPIFKHYYGETAPATCQMRISFGLGSLFDTVIRPAGSSFSRHLRGEAVDFSMVGVEPSQLYKDLKNGELTIPFGVFTLINGMHITLPYNFEGYEVKGVLMSSPYMSKTSLELEFV
jgi:hypothetical protein